MNIYTQTLRCLLRETSKCWNIFYKHCISYDIKLHFIGNFISLIAISQKSQVLKLVEKEATVCRVFNKTVKKEVDIKEKLK